MTDREESRDRRQEEPPMLTALEVIGMFAGLGLPVTDDDALIKRKISEQRPRKLRDKGGFQTNPHIRAEADEWFKNVEALQNRRAALIKVVYDQFAEAADLALRGAFASGIHNLTQDMVNNLADFARTSCHVDDALTRRFIEDFLGERGISLGAAIIEPGTGECSPPVQLSIDFGSAGTSLYEPFEDRSNACVSDSAESSGVAPAEEFPLDNGGTAEDAEEVWRGRTGESAFRPGAAFPPSARVRSARYRPSQAGLGESVQPTRATARGAFGFFERFRRNKVDCTVFAPPETRSGDALLIQVFAHLPARAKEAKAAAVEFDKDAERRGATSLGTRVRRGSKLTFELAIAPLQVDEPVKELVWQRKTDSVQFAVAVPEGLSPRTVIGRVLVSQDSVPIGQVSFKVGVVSGAAGIHTGPVSSGEARRYEWAFISYSTKDRGEVLRRVQMLTAVGVKFFQDVLNLEPGDHWLEKIHKWIEESDVFLLFWSANAKASSWVEKEWRHALLRREEDFIRPVIIEGPPIAEPPAELAHLHFGDRTLYFIRASQ